MIQKIVLPTPGLHNCLPKFAFKLVLLLKNQLHFVSCFYDSVYVHKERNVYANFSLKICL